MEYAEKMFLVPQHQLDKLKSSNTRESIQQVVENDLDMTIRNILHRSDLDHHEKAKMYTGVLQRFLTLTRQGDRESGTLTLRLPQPSNVEKEDPPAPGHVRAPDDLGDFADEILKNIPQRSVKNVRYILDKMSKTKDVTSWTESGEFVFKGRTIPGSHMLDLVKSVTAPQKIVDERRPGGWREFLEAFASLNLPYSVVPNHNVRHAINSFKTKSTTSITGSSKRSKKQKDPSRWLSF
jgi:hypothetical protein